MQGRFPMNLLADPNKHVDMSDPCSVVHYMKNAHKYEVMQKNSYKTRLYKH
jgi:hypothetical protein